MVTGDGAPRQWRILGAVLISLGAALLIFVTVAMVRGESESRRFDQDRPDIERRLAAGERLATDRGGSVVTAEPGPERGGPNRGPSVPPWFLPFILPAAPAIASPSPVAVTPLAPPAASVAPTGLSPATPTPSRPEPAPGGLPPVRVVAPAIGLDSPIVIARRDGDEWYIPGFVVSQLETTDNPGPTGNVVLTGHVDSIDAGRVFARLRELKPGDRLQVYTTAEAYEYTVARIARVANDDTSVLRSTVDPQLTLITCTGSWLPLAGDYSERLVVTARLAGEPGPF